MQEGQTTKHLLLGERCVSDHGFADPFGKSFVVRHRFASEA